MKKIYSLALVAMMALCAMVVASCGSDDDEEVTPTSTTFEFEIYYDEDGGSVDEAKTAIRSYYSQKLKAIDGITYSGDMIKGSSKIKDQVIAALKVEDYDALDEQFKEMTGLTVISFGVRDSHNTKDVYTKHRYAKETPAFDTSVIVGTWKCSTEAGDYILTVTSEKTTGSIDIYDYYVSTGTDVDGTEYPGATGLSKNTGRGSFESTEKDAFVISYSSFTDDTYTSFTGSVRKGTKVIASGLTFTKQ